MSGGSAVFPRKHLPSENIIGENTDCGEEEPQYSEQQTYLTEKIERELFIVPNLPVEPEVYYTAADKLKYSDNY